VNEKADSRAYKNNLSEEVNMLSHIELS